MADLTKLVACRLPQALVAAAQRHADVYHSSVSELLRQGLEYRLACKAWPPETPEAASAIPPHVHEVLAEMARRLDQVRQELGPLPDASARMPNRSPAQEDAVPYEDIPLSKSYTSEDRLTVPMVEQEEERDLYNSITSSQQDAQGDYDPTKFVLGKLCPRGHAYRGTTQTLLRLPSRICPQCHAARQRAQRLARHKTPQTAQ